MLDADTSRRSNADAMAETAGAKIEQPRAVRLAGRHPGFPEPRRDITSLLDDKMSLAPSGLDHGQRQLSPDAVTVRAVAVVWYSRCSALDDSMVEKHGPASVLVIDDDPHMRRLLRDFLVRGGYRVVEASNGDHGISLVEAERIDVVILDKEMPGMNGLDILSFLRQRCPGLPIIFITAFGGPEVADECRRRGARHYIEKPFRVAAIVDTVQAILDTPTA